MVETQVIELNSEQPEPEVIGQAAKIIRSGGLVAFPTETVYGLGADALSEAAVKKIFAAKERPFHDPIIIHIVVESDLDRLAVEIPAAARRLAAAFWPGPLTLVLRRSDLVPDAITAGGPTVAVRCPAHPIARALITAAGTPIGAPSANRFTHTSPTTAQHVQEDMEGRVDLILDGGPTPVGVESTVVDCTGRRALVLRPGGITVEALQGVLGMEGVMVAEFPAGSVENELVDQPAPLPSPGLMERHYAPRTPLWLYDGPDKAVRRALRAACREARAVGRRVTLLLAAEDRPYFTEEEVVIVGPLHDLEAVARNLFAALRAADRQTGEVILARSFPADGLGLAVRDRLRRAAERVVEV